MDKPSLQNASVAFSRASSNDFMADLKCSLARIFNEVMAFVRVIASLINEPVSLDDRVTKVACLVDTALFSFESN